jgi:hypothetical protein
MEMNVKEITQRLYAIGTAILEKTGDKPWIAPSVTIRDDECCISLYCTKGNDRYHIFHISRGETPEAALDDADATIAALPDPVTAKLHNHMKRVADCIDKAAADGIDDEYVTPLRMTVKAISDNLLAPPVSA